MKIEERQAVGPIQEHMIWDVELPPFYMRPALRVKHGKTESDLIETCEVQ